MDRFIEVNVRARGMLQEDPATPADQALASIARRALRILRAERDDIRVASLELDPFPELQQRVRREVMQANYRGIAAWLRGRAEAGELRPDDSEAVAAVVFGSLAMFRVFEALWGDKLLPLSDAPFADAWVEIITRGLAPDA